MELSFRNNQVFKLVQSRQWQRATRLDFQKKEASEYFNDPQSLLKDALLIQYIESF